MLANGATYNTIFTRVYQATFNNVVSLSVSFRRLIDQGCVCCVEKRVTSLINHNCSNRGERRSRTSLDRTYELS